MHGDKSQRQREAALARFERGEVWTLVATDVAARGIDVPDVVRVINYDAPEDRAAYVHRIGRTGRAGRTGTGISFVLADEVKEMRSIARQLGIEFGDGHTEGGAAEPMPSGEGQRPQGEKRRGGSGKPAGAATSAPRWLRPARQARPQRFEQVGAATSASPTTARGANGAVGVVSRQAPEPLPAVSRRLVRVGQADLV